MQQPSNSSPPNCSAAGKSGSDPPVRRFTLRETMIPIFGYLVFKTLMIAPFLVGLYFFSEGWKIILAGFAGWLTIWLIVSNLKTK